MISLALAVHMLAAVIWVGGMFFAFMILRPVAAAQLGPPQRLPLWRDVFALFFRWVWAIVVILPLTGLWLIFRMYGGMGGSPPHVHMMLALGIVMIVIFLYVYFVTYRRFRVAVSHQEWQSAGKALGMIRTLIGVNLVFGLVVMIAVSVGRLGFG